MSDEQDQAQPRAMVDAVPEKDWFLQSLLNMVNGTDMEIGVTLTVGGFLVSGTMMSGHKYFELFGRDFASGCLAGADAEVINSVASSFARHGTMYTEARANETPLPEPGFVHLRDAKLWGLKGETLPTDTGMLWRGRLSEVSGFVLGTIGPGKATT